jgi:hypothetical protein
MPDFGLKRRKGRTEIKRQRAKGKREKICAPKSELGSGTID